MDKTVKYKLCYHKSPRENSKISYIPRGTIFAEISPREREIKGKNKQMEYIKLKSFCMAKETSIKMKREPTVWRTHLPMIYQTRVQYPKYRKNSYDSTPGRQIKKWAQNLNRHFSKEDIQMAHRHKKRCSILQITREMQIKTTVRHHLTPVRTSERLPSINL